MTTTATPQLGELDPEEFCSDCFAGLESDEHHTLCVVPAEEAQRAADAPDGFAAGDAYSIAVLYNKGVLTREELIDQLSRFPYPPGTVPGGEVPDDWWPQGPWEDVVEAFNDGLLDVTTKAQVRMLATQHQLSTPVAPGQPA